MPTLNHIEFIEANRSLIKEPILIIGSKIYDYDQKNLQDYLKSSGFNNFVGADISEGEGVDIRLDAADKGASFWQKHENYFQTVFFMEILTHIPQLYDAAENVTRIIAPGGALFLAECTVRKISKMPLDLWRFTYDGLKVLFPQVEFNDAAGGMFHTRIKKKEPLRAFSYGLPAILKDERHPHENDLGFFLRRVHRKISGDIFQLSRLLPETTVCAVGKKIKS